VSDNKIRFKNEMLSKLSGGDWLTRGGKDNII